MIADIIYARDFAAQFKKWVIIVVPPEKLSEALTHLSGIANGHPFGGRTVSLTGGGKVSVAQAADTVFTSEPFESMFLGWGESSNQSQELTRWRTASRSVQVRA